MDSNSNKKEVNSINKKSKSSYKKSNKIIEHKINIEDSNRLNKKNEFFEITYEYLEKKMGDTSIDFSIYFDSIFKMGKEIVNLNSTKLNQIDSVFYFNKQKFTGIIEDENNSEELYSIKRFTVKQGKLNGPFYETGEGANTLYGNFKDGKKNGWFINVFGEVDWIEYTMVFFENGIPQKNEYIDGYGRRTTNDLIEDNYKQIDSTLYK